MRRNESKMNSTYLTPIHSGTRVELCLPFSKTVKFATSLFFDDMTWPSLTFLLLSLLSLFFSRRAVEPLRPEGLRSSPLSSLSFLGFMSSTLSFVERLRLFARRVSGLRPSPSRSSFFVPFPLCYYLPLLNEGGNFIWQVKTKLKIN